MGDETSTNPGALLQEANALRGYRSRLLDPAASGQTPGDAETRIAAALTATADRLAERAAAAQDDLDRADVPGNRVQQNSASRQGALSRIHPKP